MEKMSVRNCYIGTRNIRSYSGKNRAVGAHLTGKAIFREARTPCHVALRSALERLLDAPDSRGHFGIILSMGLKGCQRDPLSFVTACRKDTFEGADLPWTC